MNRWYVSGPTDTGKNMYVWGTKAPRILACLDSTFLSSVQASPDETEPSGRVKVC